jgi:2-polyprenyl-6-methoxyphenol hydroxylase-like FAD-dependent oxidoreductase
MFSPRRTILDKIMVDAARAAGAQVREDFHVDEILVEGGRAVGVRGATAGGPEVVERARLVIGADGKHSIVARTMHARAYEQIPPRSMACYTYWAGVEVSGGEMYSLPRRSVGAWPTNEGLVMTYICWPIEEFETFRHDVEGNALATLDLAGDLGKRVREGTRAERFRTTPDTPNRFHHPYGPGWALVGDAGLVLDPITGQGISHAFRDAELLAGAVADGLGGRRPLEAALAGYVKARDDDTMPMYRFTTDLASFQAPRPEEQALFAALARKPAEAQRFIGVLGGAIPLAEYMTPKNMMRVLGAAGMARMVWQRMRGAGAAAG